MILQALKEYYDRKAADPDSGMAPEGWEWKEIPYLVLIDEKGRFCGFQDTREGEGKKKRAHAYLIPSLGEKKGSGIKANLFWETIEYVFGIPVPKKDKAVNNERVATQHKAFCERILSIDGDCTALQAAHKFAKSSENADLAKNHPLWPDVLGLNQNLLLTLRGKGPLTDDVQLRNAVDATTSLSAIMGRCLVTSDRTDLANLEAAIKGVRGAQSTGASLVSFNLQAFNSFAKEQGANAPIGKPASFAYTTALNYLLRKDSLQRLLIGDATTVFWADRDCDLERDIPSFFDEPPKDDPDRGVNAVRSLFEAVETGAFVEDKTRNRFFVLGLAPNAARISVRFWHVGTVAEMEGRIAQHFHDLEIVHGPRDKDFFSLFRLLVSIASQGKADNIPPNLAGETMRAILDGRSYPATLLQAAVRRNRAEQNVTYVRAALIKACINRRNRFNNSQNQTEKELTMALDLENKNIGYRLGRLFATLEKIQAEANPGINATIRDRFYGAASSTPVTVFGNLMRLKNHHLAKLENAGRRVNFERLLAEIHSEIQDYPSHLTVGNQGRFAIGYYHQMQDFYTKKDKTKGDSSKPGESSEN
jgi:CRISPR-associated protein Csd1